jgi:hypothetical protein
MASSENGAAVPSALVAVGEASAVLSFNSIPQTLATQTHAIGVIAPPPDIRAIADKTAQFVARNGRFSGREFSISRAGCVASS